MIFITTLLTLFALVALVLIFLTVPLVSLVSLQPRSIQRQLESDTDKEQKQEDDSEGRGDHDVVDEDFGVKIFLLNIDVFLNFCEIGVVRWTVPVDAA